MAFLGMWFESNYDLQVAHLEADITDTTCLLPQETYSVAVDTSLPFFLLLQVKCCLVPLC